MSAQAPDIRLIVPAGTGFAPETVGRAIILTSPLLSRSGLTELSSAEKQKPRGVL